MTRDTGGGDAAPTDLDLTRLLQALTVESDRYAERFGARHGLHRTDVNALALILAAARRGEPMSPSTLARDLELSPSATTALIDRLEAVGHVKRERPGGDRVVLGFDGLGRGAALALAGGLRGPDAVDGAAVVVIHAPADPRRSSKRVAVRHTSSRASCATSSA